MKNRVALVTGASRGIGAAVAKVMRDSSVKILTPSRKEMDLSDSKSICRYVNSLDTPVDILVNNAGVNYLGGVTEITEIDIHQTLQINLVAPLLLTSMLAEKMKTRGYGRILNMSSIWSLVSREYRIVYSASKSAINGITRALALELAPYNVLVNALAPGYVNTDLTKQNNTPEQLEEIKKMIPLGRLAEPFEIAEYAAFLCSDKNTYMTGQVLVVDGGYTCK